MNTSAMITLEVGFYVIGIIAFTALAVVSVRFWLIMSPLITKLQELLPTFAQTLTDLPPLVKKLRETSESLADLTGQVRSVGESAGSLARSIFKKKQG